MECPSGCVVATASNAFLSFIQDLSGRSDLDQAIVAIWSWVPDREDCRGDEGEVASKKRVKREALTARGRVEAFPMVAGHPMTGDAVPGPLAFCALRQQHGRRASHAWLVTCDRWPGSPVTGHGALLHAKPKGMKAAVPPFLRPSRSS
jgi:hypothetical protein